ncbi:hypothetical protein GCM10023325_14030 [Sphingomonas lutea]
MFVNRVRFGANGIERLADDRARAALPRARDKVDQLAPAHRSIVAVAGRLVQDSEQAIVETHVNPVAAKTGEPTIDGGGRTALGSEK